MKLFEYWTELPATLAEIFFEEISKELVQFSKIIQETSMKILTVQNEIIKKIKELNFKDLTTEDKNTLQTRLTRIEKEKSSLAVQGIKTLTKIFGEVLKFFNERVSTPSKENLTQLKLTLNFTRSILEKLNEESSFSITQSTQANNAFFNKNLNNTTEIENEVNMNKNISQIKFVCDEETQKLEFIKIFTVFIEKIQSKLYTRSNDFITEIMNSHYQEVVNKEREIECLSSEVNNENKNKSTNNLKKEDIKQKKQRKLRIKLILMKKINQENQKIIDNKIKSRDTSRKISINVNKKSKNTNKDKYLLLKSKLSKTVLEGDLDLDNSQNAKTTKLSIQSNYSESTNNSDSDLDKNKRESFKNKLCSLCLLSRNQGSMEIRKNELGLEMEAEISNFNTDIIQIN